MEERDVRVLNVYRGKNLQLIGALVFVIGLLVLVLAWDNFQIGQIGLLLILGGFAVGFVGRIKHWYHAE